MLMNATKKLFLLLSFPILLFPGLVFAATQNIHIEWTYDYEQIEGKSLAGYNLYQEGVKVCTTNTPEDLEMDCVFESDPGTFNFTITAFFSDETESPQSPSYAFVLNSEDPPPPPENPVGNHNFSFSWETKGINQNNVSGHKIYLNNTVLCETDNPTATGITCRTDILSSLMSFSVSTKYTDGSESSQSNLIQFDPSDYPQFSSTKRLNFSWDYPAKSGLAGFKIYKNNQQICKTSNPLDRKLTCTTEITGSPVTFNLTAMDTAGVETTFSNPLVYSTDSAPSSSELKAIITPNSTEGSAPLTIAFDGASSTGEINTFSWAFGDGSSSSINNIDHQYTIPGTYNVQLTVTDTSGNTNIATTAISVTKGAPVIEPPLAVISSSTALGQAPLDVSFNGNGSSAPNSEITLYQWAFGDGSSATGKSVTHSFTTAGTFNTTLTVTNSTGLTDSISTPIIVTSPPVEENKPPQAIFTATPTSGDAPLTVVFNASASNDSDGTISSYTWQFGDGSSGSGISTTHTYTNLGTFTATLVITDNDGAQNSSSTAITVDPETTSPDFNIELGEISINSNWARVTITTPFQNPIVVAGPPSSADSEPCVIRIQNISPTGFDIRLDEWDYLDENHGNETVSYIIMEKGHFILENGTQVEAGMFNGTTSFLQQSFVEAFTNTPVVLTTVTSSNETDSIAGRLKNISAASFSYYFREQEQNSNTHQAETVHFIAWEQGTGTLGTLIYEAQKTTDVVTNNQHTITFQSDFNIAPLFLADMQTTDGADTASVRYQAPTATNIQVKIEEEQSKDIEVGHTSEVVGYLAIGSSEVTVPTNNGDKLFTFTWTYDNAIKNLTGFKFYQNNQLICEETNAAARSTSCTAPLLDTEMSFTITAVIVGNETQPLGLMLVPGSLFKRKVTFTWTFDQQQEASISGFGIYADDTVICAINDPGARTIACEIVTPKLNTSYTVKAIQPDNTNTEASNVITY